MAIAIALYNGFNVGIEHTINRPMWGLNEDGEWIILEFTGVVIHLACFRFSIGSFYNIE